MQVRLWGICLLSLGFWICRCEVLYAQAAPAKDALWIGINQYDHASFSELQYSELDATARVLKNSSNSRNSTNPTRTRG